MIDTLTTHSTGEVSPGDSDTVKGPRNQVPSEKRACRVEESTPWVEIVHDVDSLGAHRDAWEDLVQHALEPNVYFEPWMFLPAVRHLRGDYPNLCIALVYAPAPAHQPDKPLLCGLFPLERHRRYKVFPLSCLRLWDYGHSFLMTPLVRKDRTQECLATLFGWMVNRQGASFLDLIEIGGEGPFAQALVDHVWKQGTLLHQGDTYTRAFFRPMDCSEAYLATALSPNKRRDLQRKQRRLMELGKLEYRLLDSASDLPGWIENFLRLEGSGWKGKEGTALISRERDRHFFTEVALEGFQRKQLVLLGLFLDGKPLAYRCNFVSLPGSFFFKPAYDESYARFSPGVLLELENIRYLHSRPEIRWMDSCTSPTNTLLNKLWLERKIIQTVTLSAERKLGRLAVSTLALLRWVNRSLGRYTPPGE